ncbi:hypothetical protein [Shewanella sp. Actino-trap-3]|uniref:hypothetical protein n=1 Tax=Shewanella sp. Actino-trap-3 TaxID=2058331 RepID=UPI0012FEF770|nr:hypothetical protein [Shewanella sp. Actino-trap-3]
MFLNRVGMIFNHLNKGRGHRLVKIQHKFTHAGGSVVTINDKLAAKLSAQIELLNGV